MAFYSKGSSNRVLSIGLCLIVTILVLTVSCSDSNEPASAKIPETSSHVLHIAEDREFDSMSTVCGILFAAGQDPCIFVWDWANLESSARTIAIEPLAWVPHYARSEPKYPPLNDMSVLMPPRHVVYGFHNRMDRSIKFKCIDDDSFSRAAAFGGYWVCRQLRVTRNGRFLAAFLNADPINWKEGVNVRGYNGAYRLGVAHAEQMEIRWLPTFFRPHTSLPIIASISISEDGKSIAASGTFDGGCLSLIESATGNVLWEKRPQKKDLLYGKWTVNFNDVCFSPDGKLIYVAGNCGLFCFDVADGKILKQWPGLGRVMQVAVSPDGRLVAGGEVGSVYVCDARTPEQVARPILKLRTNQLTSTGLAFSPDSTLLATCGVMRNGIKIWKMPDPDSEGEFETAEPVE